MQTDRVYELLKIDHMPLKREEIDEAIKDEDWQRVRRGMKGKNTYAKIRDLNDWLDHKDRDFWSRVQVINYINALKRGGQVHD